MVTGSRVFVFQPQFGYGTGLDYRLLGIQSWLAQQLSGVGLEGAVGLFAEPRDDGITSHVAIDMLDDREVRATLLDHRASYGLLTSFTVLGAQPSFAEARLVEVQRRLPLRALLRYRLDDGGTHLPSATHEVLLAVAYRLGIAAVTTQWTEIFGTSDSTLANDYLSALGVCSACDMGFSIDEPEAALQAVLGGIPGRLRPHVELLPRLVDSLRQRGAADRTLLTAAVDAALDAIGQPPPTWLPMLQSLDLAPGPGLPN